MDEETKTCTNCQKAIPAANFTIHSVHCVSRLTVCEKCKESIPRKELQNHLDLFHKKISCDKCNEIVEKGAIDIHEKNHCCKRLVICSYCDMELLFADWNEHETYCGARTEKCTKCGHYIMMKQQSIHLASECRKLQNTAAEINKLPVSSAAVVNIFTPKCNYHSDIKVKKISVIKREPVQPNPNKRTNEMPQVNNGAKEMKKKEASKTDLQNQHYGVSNELDALLALQLSEDQESVQLHDASSSVENLPSFMMPSIEFVDSMQESRQTQTSAVHSIWGDVEDDVFKNFVSPLEVRSSEEDPSLPCEFCGELYSADELILHQSGCRPDVAHGLENFMTIDNSLAPSVSSDRDLNPDRGDDQWVAATGNAMNTTDLDLTQLPCEFCGEQFPLEFLVEHQNYCEENACSREPSPINETEDKNILHQPFPDKKVTNLQHQENHPCLDGEPDNAVNNTKSYSNLPISHSHASAITNINSKKYGNVNFGTRSTITDILNPHKTVPIKVVPDYPSRKNNPGDNIGFSSSNGLIGVRLRPSGAESINEKLFVKQAQKQIDASKDSRKKPAGTYSKFQVSPPNVHREAECSGYRNANREHINRTELPRHLDVGNTAIRDAYRNYMTSSNIRARVTRQGLHNRPDTTQENITNRLSTFSHAGAVPKNKDH